MRILRDTLVAVLNLEADIDVVAEVADGTAIVPAVVAERPDVAVVDIDLPGADGLAAAAALHEQCPQCRVLILTVLDRPGEITPRSLRWFGLPTCTANPEGEPPSLAQHGSCRRPSTSPHSPFRTHRRSAVTCAPVAGQPSH
jgi:chemotaxis response regulator CheB